MITIALISILFLCEAWLEVAVIRTKADNVDQIWNHKEHFRSVVYAGLLIAIACAYCISIKDYWALPSIIVARRIFFDFGLSIMRKRPLLAYEGNDWWSGAMRSIFRNHWIELIIELIIYFAYLLTSKIHL